MKKALFLSTIIGGSFLCNPIFSQVKETHDSLGLPGDNLNLYGVLYFFQKSETLEEFEEKLNSEDSKINNLDLNGNNKIDYISVKDFMNGKAHAVVLQVAMSEKETQDVAVIEVEKDLNDKVQIQIIGDEQLYGKNYIIEPKDNSKKYGDKAGTPNPGYNGKTTITNNYYNSNNGSNYGGYAYGYPVESWSIINFLFFPSYLAYSSPWRWGYYPRFWNPWSPLYWHSYYSYNNCYHSNYYGYSCRSNYYRNNSAHNYYGQRRSSSANVNQRIAQGEYKNTYGRYDLAIKGSGDGRSTKGNKISNLNYQNTRANNTQNAAVKDRIESSRNNESRLEAKNVYQNERNVFERNNSRGSRLETSNSSVKEIDASKNNRGNSSIENSSYSRRYNYADGQNRNSSSRNYQNFAPRSSSFSAPKSSRVGGNIGGSRLGGGSGSHGGGGSHGWGEGVAARRRRPTVMNA